MYTTVYTRVHNCALSIVSVGVSYVRLSGLTLGHPRDETKALYRMWNNPPRELEIRIDKGGLCVSPKMSEGIAWLVVGAYCVYGIGAIMV